MKFHCWEFTIAITQINGKITLEEIRTKLQGQVAKKSEDV